jgi:UDPglucose 6-dehydrogenase
VADKKIAVFGFAFKKDTNDTRESPAIRIVRDLLEEQAHLVVYDPKVPTEKIRADILGSTPSPSSSTTSATLGLQSPSFSPNPDRLTVANSPYDAAADAHAIALLTEWDEFKILDFSKIYNTMKKPAFLFDGRNILDLDALKKLGFHAYGLGK